MRRNGSRRSQALRVLRRIHDRWDGDVTSTRGIRGDEGAQQFAFRAHDATFLRVDFDALGQRALELRAGGVAAGA
jgi:hypothetical protein